MGRLLGAFPQQFMLIVPATVVLYLISPLLAPGSVSASSMLTVLSFASILAIAAIGQTLVVQQGGLDLSVAGVISLAAVLVTKFPSGADTALIPCIAAAIGAGLVSGLICGIAITRFSVTPLVATLAINALLYGTVLYLTKGTSTEAVPPTLNYLAAGRIFGIPHLAVFRTNSAHRRGSHQPVAVGDARPPHGFEAHVLHQRSRLLHHVQIGLLKDNFLAGALPARLFTGLLRPADDRALAERIESMHQNAAETAAVRDQKSHRRNAPDNAEHGEETACHIPLQRGPGLDNDFNQHRKAVS